MSGYLDIVGLPGLVGSHAQTSVPVFFMGDNGVIGEAVNRAAIALALNRISAGVETARTIEGVDVNRTSVGFPVNRTVS